MSDSVPKVFIQLNFIRLLPFQRLYLIPGLLLLIPAAYVIALLESTIQAENKATRNNIKEIYQSHLVDASNKLTGYWKKVEQHKSMNSLDPVDILSATGADSIILYDNTGRMIFPILPSSKFNLLQIFLQIFS